MSNFHFCLQASAQGATYKQTHTLWRISWLQWRFDKIQSYLHSIELTPFLTACNMALVASKQNFNKHLQTLLNNHSLDTYIRTRKALQMFDVAGREMKVFRCAAMPLLLVAFPYACLSVRFNIHERTHICMIQNCTMAWVLSGQVRREVATLHLSIYAVHTWLPPWL